MAEDLKLTPWEAILAERRRQIEREALHRAIDEYRDVIGEDPAGRSALAQEGK